MGNFQAIEPGDDTGKKSVDQIILDGRLTSDGFRNIAYLQWQADRKAGRSTWAVVGSEYEAAFLKEDLLEYVMANDLSKADQDALVSDLDKGSLNGKQDKSRLLVVTFAQLHQCLRLACDGNRWMSKEDPARFTIVMDFGWGKVTYDMAASCICLLVVQRQRVGMGSCSISAATVSSSEKAFFLPSAIRKGSRLFLTGDDLQPRSESFVWHGEASQGRLLLDIEERRAGRLGGRAILLTNCGQLEEDCTSQGGTMPLSVSLMPPLPTDVVKLRDGNSHIMLQQGLAYLGPARDIRHVLVDSHDAAWFVDKGLAPARFTPHAPRSRAQIEHVACSRDELGRAPQVHCFMTRAQYDALPEFDVSPSQTVDIDKVLLSGIWVASRCGMSLAQVGFKLADDEFFVEERLWRLNLRDLVVVDISTFPSQGRRLLNSPLKLTAIGEVAESFLSSGIVASVNVACLLAQWIRGPLRSPSVDISILSLASVLETNNGTTSIGDTIWTTGEYVADGLDLDGVAAALLGRGCIWMAVAIWHRLRQDSNWRGHDATPFVTGTAPAELQIGQGIWVDRQHSFRFDAAFEKLKNLWPHDLQDDLAGVPLADAELLGVEEMLVRAFIDNIVFVDYGNHYDLLSQEKLSNPSVKQVTQLDVRSCRQVDIDAAGQAVPPGRFCIHTCIHHTMDKTVPVDLTHVSARALFRVLVKSRSPHSFDDIFSRVSAPRFW